MPHDPRTAVEPADGRPARTHQPLNPEVCPDFTVTFIENGLEQLLSGKHVLRASCLGLVVAPD
jgi:hypothetical protein